MTFLRVEGLPEECCGSSETSDMHQESSRWSETSYMQWNLLQITLCCSAFFPITCFHILGLFSFYHLPFSSRPCLTDCICGCSGWWADIPRCDGTGDGTGSASGRRRTTALTTDCALFETIATCSRFYSLLGLQGMNDPVFLFFWTPTFSRFSVWSRIEVSSPHWNPVSMM